ncbi:hypothetical protein ACVIWV_001046 [Bradyrhizobium diazoefficiens]|uniref:Glycosyltransferase RgtA/B/C/D-like domain-containing protein n=1 Tax=Bradyrhizobium diazoefficiens TaxID=1355477 RepID=A0A0E3VSR8_9BRAD|nr:hypothetical protein NK6_1200 [Bradyrhizobium diazoefficiens]
MELSVQDTRSTQNTISASLKLKICAVAAIAFLIGVFSIWVLAPPRGWAADDARIWHFPVIDFLITNGYRLDYDPDLIAMFPGMHLFFAFFARLLGIKQLSFDGLQAFLIQSILGLFFLFGLFRIVRQLAVDLLSTLLLITPVLSSSYVWYSWVWPTPDLGSLTFYTWMVVLLLKEPPLSPSVSIAFSGLTAGAMLFRQSNAVLGFSLIPNVAPRILSRSRSSDLSSIGLALLPALTALLGIGFLLLIWGHVVPPHFVNYHSAKGLNVVNGVHTLALSGLVCWPFALLLLRNQGYRPTILIPVAAAASVLTLLCYLSVPLDYDKDAGRWGSLVWTIEQSLAPFHLGSLFVCATIFVGATIWTLVGVRCWQVRQIAPEISLFCVFAAGLLFEYMSWQRYVEPQLLISLSVFCAREKLNSLEGRIGLGWFSAYAVLSIMKPFIS